MTAPLILASSSPRRTEILRAMGIAHEVVPSTVDESTISADHPRTFALRAAFAKAQEVAKRVTPGRWVLGADTVVTKNLILFGKPIDATDARRMLSMLAGEEHQVVTALALVESGKPNTWLRAETTRVQFKPLQADAIEEYIATGEPADKAGAYGIQGHGGELVDHIRGDYYNVVGLPCQCLADLLEEAGLQWPLNSPPVPDRWRSR